MKTSIMNKTKVTILLFQILTMTESDLNTYRLQLQQVEAALTTDPENEVSPVQCSLMKY